MGYDSAYRNLERQYQVVLPDTLGNPALGFRDGVWFRISAGGDPEPISLRGGILQCPAAAGSIVQIVCWWMREYSQTPRALDLATELAMTVSELARTITGDPLSSSIGGSISTPIAGALTSSLGGSAFGMSQGPDQSRYDALADPLNDPLVPQGPVAASAATTLMPALRDVPGNSGTGWPAAPAAQPPVPPGPRAPAPAMPAPLYRDEPGHPQGGGRYAPPDPYRRGAGDSGSWFRDEERDSRFSEDDRMRDDEDRAPWRDRGPRGAGASGRYDRPMPDGRGRGVPSAPPRPDIPLRPAQQRPAPPRRDW
jgi:hypothetical protein